MNDRTELLSELKIERGPDDTHVSSGSGRWWLLGLVAAAAAAGGWWLSRAPQSIEVSLERAVAAPGQGASASVLDASGYVTARRLATVSSKVTGKVVEVLIEEGMAVEEGQLLARLDDASVQADFALAEASHAAARSALKEIRVLRDEALRSLQRTRELRERGLASESELDAAESGYRALVARFEAREKDVDVAEKALAVQRQRLADTEIRSPFSGVIIAKAAQPGEMISPVSAGGGFTRTGIGTVVDMDSLEIEVDVNEAYIQRVSAGQGVTATLDAYPDWEIPARVIAIIPTADRQKATVRVRIGFEALDPRILPDMGVKVAFHGPSTTTTESTTAAGVLISGTSIRRSGDSEFVFRYNDGVVERRAVATAGRVGAKVLVTAGLNSGDRVVAAVPPELGDGDAVRLAGSDE